ncbi:MAG: hypothetical protein Kow00109_16290 [Acidobacteriota bacterium]
MAGSFVAKAAGVVWLGLGVGLFGAGTSQEPAPVGGAAPQVPPNVEFRHDLRVFTVMAAVTAAGFAANRDSQRHPEVPVLVREHLAGLEWEQLEALRWAYRSHPFPDLVSQYTAYISLALLLEDPPVLRLQENAPVIPEDVRAILGFERYLADFYQKAEILRLWEKVRPYYDAALKDYHPVMAAASRQVLDYARTPERAVLDRTMVIIPDLLGLRDVVHARNVEGAYLVVVGPTDDPKKNLVELQHEFLHFLFDPVIEKFGGTLLKERRLLELAEQQPELHPTFRDQFLLLVGESLVESILLHLHPPEDRRRALAGLFRRGYILAPYISGRLDEYERDPSRRLPDFLYEVFQEVSRDQVEEDGEMVARWERELRAEAEAAQAATEERRRAELARQEAIRARNEAARRLAGGDLAGAAEMLDQVLAADPQDPVARFYLAQLRAQEGNFPAAAELYAELAQRDDAPPWIRAWSLVRWGRFLASQGDEEGAAARFRAVERLPGDLKGAREAAAESLQVLQGPRP